MTSTLKLLVLEDAEADFRLIVRHLRQHGFEADCQRVARLGELDRALTFDDIDAVLAHYHVPGLETAGAGDRIRSARGAGKNATAPVVSASGRPTHGAQQRLSISWDGTWVI